MHPLWFYKHQHHNRVRSKLFVACQRWWFQWRFWFVPSVPGYLREEEEHKPDPWRNPIERNHMGLQLKNEVAVVKTPTIISKNPIFQRRAFTEFFCDTALCDLVRATICSRTPRTHATGATFRTEYVNIVAKRVHYSMNLQSLCQERHPYNSGLPM